MIVAEIYKQQDGKIIGFSIDGHANTAPKGYDIYCAGVSTVSQAAFLCIRDYLKREFDWDADSGRLMMKLENQPDDLTEVVFRTMLIGLQEISKVAPKTVLIKTKIFKEGELK